MNCYLIDATSLKAFWAHGLLYLAASGDTECPQFANISQSPATIVPAEYQLTTCACTAIGTFPFNVHAWFHVGEQPETVTIHTADGAHKIDVEAFPTDLIEDLATPAALTGKLGDDEVVGMSPNSWDVNRAIGDAVSQLQARFPGSVNATVTETGVVAVGSPVGIAFLYVRMKQSPDKAAKRKTS